MAGNEKSGSTVLDENDGSEEIDENILRLKIQPQPPKFPFVNQAFETSVYLVDGSDHLKRGHSLPLKLELLYADKLLAPETNIMHLEGNTKPEINADGICKLRIRISECSMNRKFILSITPKMSEMEEIASVMTHELMVVQHRLVIQAELPELWYKDEGGRDKCMVLPVHLLDANMKRVCNREVRLKVSLLYDNEHLVMKQDILKLSPESQRMIDATGEAFIRFRIEDVSKNHQGQTFRVKIEADTQHSPMNYDVSYDLSTIISVRSKRNKRARTKLSPSNATPTMSTQQPIHYGVAQSSHISQQHDSGGGIMITEEAKRKVRDAAASMAGSAATAPPGSLNGAMAGVIQWTSAVVNGLHALEWQVIGHESKSDGTPDHSRPLYRCPSCWRYKDVLSYHTAQHGTNCVIANILMQYATETMVNLHTILKAVDASAVAYGRTGQAEVVASQSSNSSHRAASSSGPPQLARGITDMVNNLDMPSLLRGASGGLNDIMSSLGDASASSVGGSPPSAGMGSFGQHQSMNASIEQRVYYVLAKIQNTEVGGGMGFPSFDQNQQLLGYYQEGQDNATTEVIFISLNDIQGTLTQRDVSEAHQMLMAEAKSNSGAVHSLPKCSNNLVKMKEDALMYHWSNGARDIGSMGW